MYQTFDSTVGRLVGRVNYLLKDTSNLTSVSYRRIVHLGSEVVPRGPAAFPGISTVHVEIGAACTTRPYRP